MNAGEFSVENLGDRAVIEFGAGFDLLSSAPGGGLHEGVRRISVGAEMEDAFCILPSSEGRRVSVKSGNFGRTSAVVVAVSDLREGIGRVTEECPRVGGTHLVVIMDCDMPVSAMARATMTAEEAVTVAIQDFGLACDDTMSLGSGSSILSITAVRNTESDIYLHGAGKHSKLGELIGACSRDAVKESAEMNGMTSELTGSVKRRFSRIAEGRDLSGLDTVDRDPDVLSQVAACMFIADEARWGLIPEDVARKAVLDVLSALRGSEITDDGTEIETSILNVIQQN